MNRCTVRHLVPLLLTVLTPAACTSSPSPSARSPVPTTSPSGEVGKRIVVSSALDSGPGTLRQALLDAEAGDVVTFDPAVFSPDAPTAITVETQLPSVTQGDLTIDGSDAGVILDGSELPSDGFISGLEIASDGNTVSGLAVLGFPGAGIGVAGGRDNTIGGDRGIGAGPIGRGNLTGRNGLGIVLWGSAEGNVVSWNLIGTRANGTDPLGNHAHGVWVTEGATGNVFGPGNVIAHNGQAGIALEDGANGNTVGPDNEIAFNGENGIWIDSPRSIHNTITRNSIHENEAAAIYLSSDGNTGLIAPSVLDLDLAAGTVVGTACARCTVEIFSDRGDEAGTYEGRALADEAGTFGLHEGEPLAGPHLTAVAIDADGNTSQLSSPTSRGTQSAILQAGNARPRTTITIADHSELVGNGIGDMWDMDRPEPPCPPAGENPYVTRVLNDGFTWVRLSLDPREWWGDDVGVLTRYDGPFSSFKINRCQDEIISELADHGVTILLTIVFWDHRFHAERPPDYGNEREVRRYLAYARLLARHFGDRVRYFEILNEPVFFVDLPDYLNLIRRVVPIFRREAPKARIVAGGGAYLLDPISREYVFGLLRSDVVSSIDAVELHPMYGSSPQYDDTRQYYEEYPTLVRQMQRVARANDFSGDFLAEEMLWRTPLNAGAGQPWVYTPITAAKYLLRAIVLHRGLGVWAGIDTPTDNLGIRGGSTIPSFFQTGPRLTTILDGARPARVPIRIDSEADNVASYGFSLPNGDTLLALWTDDTAVDHDPGATADLTLGGSAEAVVGLDPFVGFQQELIVSHAARSLVVDDFIVRDYPVFLRLVGWGSS